LLDTQLPVGIPAIVLTPPKAAGLPGAKHVIAEKSGHWIQLDQPELVVNAVRELSSL